MNTQTRTASSSYADARLERALPRLEREWIPFNKAHLDHIIAGYKGGAYDIDPDRMVEELARDIGAITWLIHQAIIEGVRGKTPLEIVEALSPQRAIDLLEQRRNSTHSLEASTNDQLTVLRSSSVALGAAVGFAPATDVPVRDAMGAELLLQVGRLLVAWNYPLAFSRAVKGDPSISIDERIANEIGFSPLMLSHLLATRWELSDRFSRLTDSPLVDEGNKSLARICEISEALAAAEAPEFFPDARVRFDAASEVVRESLGPLGMKTLSEQITDVAQPYLAALGDKFCPPGPFELGAALREHKDLSNIAQAALGASRLEVRAAVRDLLNEINQTVVDVGAAKKAMETLIPLCGFSAGCLYVFDPFTKVFRQRLKIGTWHREMQVAINQLAPGELAKQISGVYSANQIEITNGDTIDVPSLLVSPLGTSARIGVLCLEASLLSIDDSGIALSHAKAIRIVIERALKT